VCDLQYSTEVSYGSRTFQPFRAHLSPMSLIRPRIASTLPVLCFEFPFALPPPNYIPKQLNRRCHPWHRSSSTFGRAGLKVPPLALRCNSAWVGKLLLLFMHSRSARHTLIRRKSRHCTGAPLHDLKRFLAPPPLRIQILYNPLPVMRP
jgi:hypothetical protein